MQAVLDGATLKDYEIQHTRKDGLPVSLSLSASPLHDPEGAVNGILILITDITEENDFSGKFFLLAAESSAVSVRICMTGWVRS